MAVIFLNHKPAFGADDPIRCPESSPQTTIFFVNGVDNTRKDADFSRVELITKLKLFIKDNNIPIDTRCLFSKLAYNSSGGLIFDLFQSVFQRAIQDYRRIWLAFSTETDDASIFSLLIQQHLLDIDFSAFVVATEILEHKSLYEKELNDGKKVVVVPHSQGNLYANESYLSIVRSDSEKSRNIGIVGVATPASFVAGYATGEEIYTTLVEDFIWLSLGALTHNSGNGNLPLTCGFQGLDWLCHSFIRSYLSGDNSGPRIYQQISSIIQNLEVPQPNDVNILTSIKDITNGTTIDFEQPGATANDILPMYNMLAVPDKFVDDFVAWVVGNNDAPINNRAMFGANFRIQTTGNPWNEIGLTGVGSSTTENRTLTLKAFDEHDVEIGSTTKIFNPVGGADIMQAYNDAAVFLGISSITPIFSIELSSDNPNTAWDNLTFTEIQPPIPSVPFSLTTDHPFVTAKVTGNSGTLTDSDRTRIRVIPDTGFTEDIIFTARFVDTAPLTLDGIRIIPQTLTSTTYATGAEIFVRSIIESTPLATHLIEITGMTAAGQTTSIILGLIVREGGGGGAGGG